MNNSKLISSPIQIIILLSLISTILFNCSNRTTTNFEPPKHIILFGSDGLGAYAFEKAEIPNLRKLMSTGSYSLEARSVLPSSSAVNWASMIMGSGPELHGYTEWGSKVPELPSRKLGVDSIYPTIFSLIKNQIPDAKVGVSYSWGGIGYLFENSLVDLDFNGSSDEETVGKAVEFIVEEKPTLTFVHVDQPDGAGHQIGHDTPEYYVAVEKIDSLLGTLIKGLENAKMLDDSVIIVSSDHGGLNKGHGGKTLLEVEIPWIITGKNIEAKGKLDDTIITYDTAAMIGYLLKLEMPEFWRGKPIKSVIKKTED